MNTKTLSNLSAKVNSLVLTLASILPFVGHATAQTIFWSGKDVYVGSGEALWYQPKLAGDEDGNFAVVGLDSGTTLGPLAYWTGRNPWNETSLDGIGNNQEYALGVSPSVAIANSQSYVTYEAAVEIHQGGQRDGAALWSHLAVFNLPDISSSLTFSDGSEYDTGYNSSVAVDPWSWGYGSTSIEGAQAEVVEVHQAAPGVSALWYHVGILTLPASGGPTLTWGPSYRFDQGNLASVTVCVGTVIEVHEGEPGTLWYSVGTVNGYPSGSSTTITWTGSTRYDSGYAPSVACDQIDAHVVEVHQATSPAAGESSALWYHVAPYTTTQVGWTPAQQYDTGCNPTVAFAYTLGDSPQYLAETHSGACGEVGPLFYDYGMFTVP